jgi:PAS domain S-box-containing protein
VNWFTEPRRFAFRVTLTYAVLSCLWIFFSDRLLALLISDPGVMATVSTIKGWFYVLVISVILFIQVRRYLVRLEAAHEEVLLHREQLLLFEFTIDKSADIILWLDPEFRVLYSNQAAWQLGYSGPKLRTMTLRDLDDGPPTDLDGFWNDLLERKSLFLSRTLRAQDGSLVPVEISVDLIDYQGRAFACAYVRDMTEKRRIEEHSRESQRLEAVGTLAAGVAHDFNNILTVIQGCSELLSLSPGDPEQARPLVEQIQAAVKRASELVRGLLAFSRKETLQLKSFEFNDLLSKMTGFLARVLGADVKIELELVPEGTRVVADPSQWEQVILNLAINARDAMGGTGILHIQTRVEGSRVVLPVRDSGAGIPADVQARIFEPFFTTKQAGGGTGLGLSVVYGIVKNHQGTIRVDSPPAGVGHGTEFTIGLPLADAPV